MSEGKTKTPNWLTEEDDGAVTISFKDLKKLPVLDGTEVSKLTMREPTVQDQLTADKANTHQGDAEIMIFANLTEQSPDAINGLTLRQYGRLQEAYRFFTG